MKITPPTEIISLCTDIGCNHLEINVYWLLLTHTHSISHIAELCNTNRVAIYNAIHTLQNKELVGKSNGVFTAISIRLLLHIHSMYCANIAQHNSTAQSYISLHESRCSQNNSETLPFHKLQKLILFLLSDSDVHDIWWFNMNWGSDTVKYNSYLHLNFFDTQFHPLRLQRNTHVMNLLNPHDTELQRRKNTMWFGKYLHGKHLEVQYSTHDPIAVFGNTILHFNTQAEAVTVVYNTPSAETLKTLYESLW